MIDVCRVQSRATYPTSGTLAPGPLAEIFVVQVGGRRAFQSPADTSKRSVSASRMVLGWDPQDYETAVTLGRAWLSNTRLVAF